MKRSKVKGEFYCGLSGLQVPVPKYLFPESYKDASRLTYYASFFNSIEINSTFYKLPLATTVTKWAQQVPDDFKFTFKLWKEITHNKGLEFKESDVGKFFLVASCAGDKKGCILIQFPPGNGKENFMQLEILLNCIQKNNKVQKWNIAVEFRNRSWYDEKVYKLLNKYQVALVVQDIPKSSTPMVDHQTDFIYLRFHGPTGNYRESYSDSFLSEYSSYIKEWMEEGKNVFTYFNNTMGDAINNAQTLNKEMLG
ncbi:MAG: hypothetical protein K0S44_416 [Bacteroidetes bacterium]|jgi:uncharacterized protein YecE (DUF72 family)|nr:hypothetical protein [Bacteroidota bacterium]